MNNRIALLFGLFAFSYVAITWINSRSDEVIDRKMDLSAIPMTLSGWVGVEEEVPDETVRVLNADQSSNRIYRDASGREVYLHLANWLNKETISAAPHHPEVCYPGAGWELKERRTTQFSTAAGVKPIELILFQKGQNRVVTGHWFQVGDVYFVSGNGFLKQRSRFWGRKSWPSTTKVLLQTLAPTLDAAEERLKDIATLIVDELANEQFG